jgi:hypothetical protein
MVEDMTTNDPIDFTSQEVNGFKVTPDNAIVMLATTLVRVNATLGRIEQQLDHINSKLEIIGLHV